MAERQKLDSIAKAWTQKDKEDFSKGASSGGPVAPKPKAKPVDNVPMGEMADIESGVAKMQAANAKNPGIQSKLNAVAKARAKFYGEE